MTSKIKIGAFLLAPNAVKWSRHVSNYSDSATIKLPAIARLKKEGDQYEKVQTGQQFKEGDTVEVLCGYDGNNATRFKGFIRRINFTIPLEIECEGYSYQLRKRLDFTRHYRNTTVKQILKDLTAGTDIKLSNKIPDIPIPKAVFDHVSGVQVLDFLKEKCLLTVHFNFDELYVGTMQTEPNGSAKFRLGWNVIKDNELKFNDKKEFAQVRIKLIRRGKDGKLKISFYGPKDGQVVEKRISLVEDKKSMDEIAQEEMRKISNRGYEGAITAFLLPLVEPGMTAIIDDKKYPERTGRYFIEGVEGEFSTSGGRQKVKIGNSLGG